MIDLFSYIKEEEKTKKVEKPLPIEKKKEKK
jgi:hypothetical protein